MKVHCSSKLGTKTRASPISFEEENRMWLCRALGEGTPDKLRNTVMCLISMSCALQGGEEHRRLHCPPYNPQIQVKRDMDGTEFLIYTEDEKSKMYQGGLYSQPEKPKVVPIHRNKFRPDHNLVHLYQKYVSLLPANGKCQALYKFSLSQNCVTPCTWYTDKPLGVNLLKKVIKTVTQQVELTRKFSNHSLRATTTTRLYQGGVNKQTIKEVTGHKSNAVRMYKHSNTQVLHDALSKIVNEQEEEKPVVVPSKIEWDDKAYCDAVLEPKVCAHSPEVEIPGNNPAHRTPCKTANKDGNCTAFCSLLCKINDKQNEHKLKRLKLSLK